MRFTATIFYDVHNVAWFTEYDKIQIYDKLSKIVVILQFLGKTTWHTNPQYETTQ